MHLSRIIFCLLGLASAPAFAGQGEVCLSKPVSLPVAGHFDNATVFQCKTAGKLTVPDMYEERWRIVTVFPQAITSGTAMSTAWTVVIEKI
jgi:hypothetical protein